MLQLITLFLVIVSFKYHVAAPPSSLSRDTFRIFGGDPIEIEKAPFMASFRPQSETWWCGASIINEKFLVTAGHCISEGRSFEILVGTNKILSGGTKYEVEKMFRHPKYDKKTVDFDIGVLKLKEKLEFSDKVKPIEMVDADVAIEAGELMTTMGYGITEKHEESEVLLSVDVAYFDQQKCKEKMAENGNDTVTDNMLCAGGELNKDTCRGDSGGPIIFKGKLAGTVSWGHGCGCGCGREGYPSVYSRLSALRQWVDDTVKENSD